MRFLAYRPSHIAPAAIAGPQAFIIVYFVFDRKFSCVIALPLLLNIFILNRL